MAKELPIFGVISEGISDYTVINSLLSGYFSSRQLDVRQIQPENGELPFGWGNLFNYLQENDLKDLFDYVDYLVIQIDVDTAQDWGVDGLPNSSDEIIEWVINILISKISTETFELHRDKIIFAIADSSIECWLLSFHATTNAHKIKDTGCLQTLNRSYLNKKGYTIDPNAKAAKNRRFFGEAAKPMQTKKNVDKINEGNNNSLLVFLNKLDEVFKNIQFVES